MIYSNYGSLFAGFFSHDMMRATSYRYANVSSRYNEPKKLVLLMIDRIKKRGFTLHDKWVIFIKTHFLLSESGMDNPVYNSFITEVLDYNGNGTDNIGASALLSGIAYNIIKLSE